MCIRDSLRTSGPWNPGAAECQPAFTADESGAWDRVSGNKRYPLYLCRGCRTCLLYTSITLMELNLWIMIFHLKAFARNAGRR